ncbi:GAF domain-containing protein [Variovorax sp. RKNM96]|uniref:GAF domain-containing protein n=1 Tax=Variovorax sp. RKNM96 TaxID=2681552 RepID=UPI00197DFAF9|nr:GAF domain-containing protein [Variovorax sp. RKNM96]QSI33176.1 GAF domain-containing protein [Variovorax sp. RKNM96]
MPIATASQPMAFTNEFLNQLLDGLAEARNADAALREVDRMRSLIAGESIFSIQQNVTTAHDPAGEIRLRRFYSSEAQRHPVGGGKRKTLTPWTECLFLQGRVFVGEGAETLARHFDDFEQMHAYGLQSVINVPLLRGEVCYATFNVFGTRPRWQPHEVLGIRLLALSAARWVPAAPGLAYRFTDMSFTSPMES